MNYGTHMTKTGQLRHCKTLADLVKEYNKHFAYKGGVERSEGHHDPVVDFCKEAPNFTACVRRAVDGRRRDGKVFSEGSCVRSSSKEKLTAELIKESRLKRLSKAPDFDAIYDIVREVKPWGIGNCTVYNVAARIAAYRGMHPEKFLYLHAGPLQGWKRLTGSKKNPYRVPIEQVPAPLRKLPIHKIEDSLCEFRDVLNPSFMP